MHKAEYGRKIQSLDKQRTYVQFRSRRHELAWLTHTTPDVAAEAVILAQVKADIFQQAHINQLNRAIKRVNDDPELGLLVHKLYQRTLRIIVHADASFAILSDLKTQLGFIILLSGDT